MSDYKMDDTYHIDSIHFSVFNNEDVKDFSSVHKEIHGINLPESYENSEPKRGGLVDTRLGITDKNIICSYCGLNDQHCVGHFGHTELSVPIFHYGFFNLVKSILNCICLRSSKLLAHKYPQELKLIHKNNIDKKIIFNEVKKLCSKVLVSDIGIPVPKIKDEKQKKTGAILIIAETTLNNVVLEDNPDSKFNKKVISEVLTPYNIYNIFVNISNEDWELMGFDSSKYRPEDLIIKNFPIPPVAIRPSIRADFLASSTYEDLLTHKLADIIKTNERLRKQLDKDIIVGEKTRYSNDLTNFLQYQISSYFDNEKDCFLISESKVGSRPFKSLSQRIKGKHGRIRGNLMGKRVNYSARSVITGDPNLKLDELGIPVKVAMELTFPEVVTPYNYDRLTNLVRNGRYIYPGANYVVQNSGNLKLKREFDLRYRKKTIKLNYGDVVERHLINDDYVLFNRQPSLHKLSMMAHKARIIDDNRYSTFRMNVSATSPYNADFDGDEMNVHAPQSLQTQTELAMIGDIKKQIITAKDGKPIIKPVQDSVLGSYLMTQNDVELDWSDIMNLVSFGYNLNIKKINKNTKYTGKYLFSQLIPNNINYNNKNIEIKNGDLLKGNIDKKTLGDLVYTCWDRNGIEQTKDLIDNIQRFVCNWILMNGFTVGLGDCYFKNKNSMNIIYKEIEKKKLEVDYLITEIENNPELLDPDTFEMTIQNNLSAQKGEIEKLVMKELDNSNNFYVMVNSGSKGKKTNIMQIIGALGQDIFQFKRIQKDVLNRTLPHFFQNDDRALARGYIEHSYLEGLSPSEFFFHHMTGREGLIDTAIKTADTGYIARRLMKALEDIGIKYDGLVRTGNNIVIQYVYGDNNINQTKQKKINFKSIRMSNTEIIKKYSFSKEDISKIKQKIKIDGKLLNKINKDCLNKILNFRNQFRIIQKLYDLNYKTLTSSFNIPVNLKRIIDDVIYNNVPSKDICNPEYIIQKINEIIKPEVTKYLYLSKKDLKNNKLLKVKDEQIAKTLFEYSLYEFLNPKRVIFEFNLNKSKFDQVINNIIKGFNDAVVDAGEMVGCVAAQHIGEVATQMTLNTFHSTGSGSVGMQGVPRCEELIRVSKNIKTPMMWLYLNSDLRTDKGIANKIASSVNYTLIKDIINDYEIIYDPNTKEGYTLKDNVDNPMYPNLKKNSSNNFHELEWLLRIKLNKNNMLEKNTTILDIKTKFLKFWKSKINNTKGLKKLEKNIINNISSSAILSNYDNSEQPIIHIRFSLINIDYNLLISIKDWFLNNIILKGIKNITNISAIPKEMLIDFNNKDSKVEEKYEYVIMTEGINMVDIRKIKDINLNRSYCNDIKEIYRLFGIEAVRNSLIKEFNNIYGEYSVNFHHISLLVDLMTNTGKITSIDRHGLNKLNRSPLSKASFEMPIDQLTKAALFNEVDSINSVSSQIMVGKVITGGTGLCQVMLDTDIIENSEFIEDIQLINRGDFIKLEVNYLIRDILNKDIKDIFTPN